MIGVWECEITVLIRLDKFASWLPKSGSMCASSLRSRACRTHRTFCYGRERDALSLVERQGAESGDVVGDHGAGLPQSHRRCPTHVFDPRTAQRLLLRREHKTKTDPSLFSSHSPLALIISERGNYHTMGGCSNLCSLDPTQKADMSAERLA